MQKLNLPLYNLNIRSTTDGKDEVLDPIRRKWLVLTPEERVRQLFIRHLTEGMGYPAGLIVEEYAFTFANGKPQRADIVVFNKQGNPYLLVECKAPSIKITEATFRQISRYNAVIKAKHIVITNGLDHYSLSTDDFIHYTHQTAIPTP